MTDQVELGGGLEGVVHGDQEGRLPHRLQHLPLRPGVLRGLLLLDDVGLLQDLHGVEMSSVRAPDLADEEDLAVGPGAEDFEKIEVLHGDAVRLEDIPTLVQTAL